MPRFYAVHAAHHISRRLQAPDLERAIVELSSQPQVAGTTLADLPADFEQDFGIFNRRLASELPPAMAFAGFSATEHVIDGWALWHAPNALPITLLRAIANTSTEHGNVAASNGALIGQLTPPLTVPRFHLAANIDLREAVAVCVRNRYGQPIDGALVGVCGDRSCVLLALVDNDRDIDTRKDPAWIPFAMLMTVGTLKIEGAATGGEPRTLPFSIAEYTVGSTRPEPPAHGAHARSCALHAFLNQGIQYPPQAFLGGETRTAKNRTLSL